MAVKKHRTPRFRSAKSLLSKKAKKAGLKPIGAFARRQLTASRTSGLSKKQAVKKVLALKTAVQAARKANPKLSLAAARKAALSASKPTSKGGSSGRSSAIRGRTGTPAALRKKSGGKFDESKHPRKGGRFTKK